MNTAVLYGGLFCFLLRTVTAWESGRRVEPTVNGSIAEAATSHRHGVRDVATRRSVCCQPHKPSSLFIATSCSSEKPNDPQSKSAGFADDQFDRRCSETQRHRGHRVVMPSVFSVISLCFHFSVHITLSGFCEYRRLVRRIVLFPTKNSHRVGKWPKG